MSWLNENIDKADVATSDIKRIKNQITDRSYSEIPSDAEGSEGEVRYVYQNARPFMCVKMNAKWHFTSLKTIGEDGAYRSDAGELSGSSFDTPMSQEPTFDSGWRQLVGVIPPAGGHQGGDLDAGSLTPTGSGAGTQYLMYSYGGGPYFECCGYVEAHVQINGTGVSSLFPVYLFNHGLGLARPPLNIMIYICSSAPSTQYSADNPPSVNCISAPPASEDIVDSAVFSCQSTFNGDFLEGTPVATNGAQAHLNSIMLANPGPRTGYIQYMPADYGPMLSMGNYGANMQVVSPNHIAFCPNWNTNRFNYGNSVDGAISNENALYEWMRVYIWR